MSFCPNCGSKVLEDDSFCGACGKKIKQFVQIRDENNNNSTYPNNADEQKAYYSAKTIGSSTAGGNLTYLKDFNYESSGIISISYIDGIVSAEDKTTQTKVHGRDGHVSSTVVKKQYIHIQTTNGKEINLTALTHIHLRIGNHVRLYYVCTKGTKPENISMPNFLENKDSDSLTYWAAPNFMSDRPQVNLKIIAVTAISAAITSGVSIVFVFAWFYFMVKK